MLYQPALRTLVVMPTYNERDSLPVTLAHLMEHVRCDVLIVDDNSPDGTGAIADELAQNHTTIHVMHRQAKDGLGAAYIAGFQWALERHYDLVCEMDADGSHQPHDLPRLLAQAEADASLSGVIGSRWVAGGAVARWPWHRQVLSRGGNLYVKFMLGLPLHDATAGFRVYRANTLEHLNLQDIESHGYCFQVDMTRRVISQGGAIAEVPITFIERESGESKMSGAIVREALLRVTQWGIDRRKSRVSQWVTSLRAQRNKP